MDTMLTVSGFYRIYFNKFTNDNCGFLNGVFELGNKLTFDIWPLHLYNVDIACLRFTQFLFK